MLLLDPAMHFRLIPKKLPFCNHPEVPIYDTILHASNCPHKLNVPLVSEMLPRHDFRHPATSIFSLICARLRVLPNLQAKLRVEVVRLSDRTLALGADVIADDAVDAYRQSAAGKVLQGNG